MSVDGTEALVEQIEATREQLGETVQELARRLDVKARTQERIAQTGAEVVAEVRSLRRTLHGAGAEALERTCGAWRRPQVRRGAGIACAALVGTILLRRCTG